MIVREEKDHFIMIEQDNHAIVSGELIKHWKKELLLSNTLMNSVNTAITLHDYGWKYFDKQPVWNDQINVPYDFTNYPLAPKTIIYTHGINEVEKEDTYAALLCSTHYTKFIIQESSSYAESFVEQERRRQKKIIQSLNNFDKNLFDFHYELLKFTDSLSLFFCINRPGVKKDEYHFFFKNGIALPSIDKMKSQILWPEWKADNTIYIDPFPYEAEVPLKIKQKRVVKNLIKKNGIVNSYEKTPYEIVDLKLSPKK
ncbi:DUF3891 family protein [Oceanobacillus sp. Castelsardo]|uniref:DUF3891 family protein n=1 Tax=Oceanobacillus sp. Castelsardo TaxID=1851204 RepID=UPI0008397472|nr:DUF3891 family protein [Oceanobacillus sp. Castelsardo]